MSPRLSGRVSSTKAAMNATMVKQIVAVKDEDLEFLENVRVGGINLFGN
jgi:hypothetical protein